MIIFVAYEGFELIANTAQDVRNTPRILPRACYSSVGFVIFLYVLIAIVTVGTLPVEKITGSSRILFASFPEVAALQWAEASVLCGNRRFGRGLIVEGDDPVLDGGPHLSLSRLPASPPAVLRFRMGPEDGLERLLVGLLHLLVIDGL